MRRTARLRNCKSRTLRCNDKWPSCPSHRLRSPPKGKFPRSFKDSTACSTLSRAKRGGLAFETDSPADVVIHSLPSACAYPWAARSVTTCSASRRLIFRVLARSRTDHVTVPFLPLRKLSAAFAGIDGCVGWVVPIWVTKLWIVGRFFAIRFSLYRKKMNQHAIGDRTDFAQPSTGLNKPSAEFD